MTDHNDTALAERAAQQANGDNARAENLKALARLASTADSLQQAEHIRGIVATTMAHLSANASSATRDSAAQWQQWALGVSEALDHDHVEPAVNP